MRRDPKKPWLSLVVRYLLPAGLAITGVGLLLVADSSISEAIGESLIGAAVLVVVANLVILMSLAAARKERNRTDGRRAAARERHQANPRAPHTR